MPIPVSFQFGIVVRKAALASRSVGMAELCKLFEAEKPSSEDRDLVSFGPLFGPEALAEFIHRLEESGLVYIDDFFDLCIDHPQWLKFSVELL